jgi:hypothetical protein
VNNKLRKIVALVLLGVFVSFHNVEASSLVSAATRFSAAVGGGSRGRLMYASLPLQFERNVGQAGKPVKFLSHIGGATLYLTDQAAILCFSKPLSDLHPSVSRLRHTNHVAPVERKVSVVQLKFIGACSSPSLQTNGPLQGTVSYFIGKDPKHWISDLATYRQVAYRGLYPGIDLVYYGNGSQLEYDFVAKPGADVKNIRLRVEGAKSVKVASDGDLNVKVDGTRLVWRKPVTYQLIHGRKSFVVTSYVAEKNDFQFVIGEHDPRYPIVVDPVLEYSTLLGGTGGNGTTSGVAIYADGDGSAYVAGDTDTTAFPLSADAAQLAYAGGFVTKYNSSASGIIYSTYFGGDQYTLTDNNVTALAVDGSGCAYVVGDARLGYNASFPTTPNAYMQNANNFSWGGFGNGYVMKLNQTGTGIDYSTLFGPSGWNSVQIYGVAVDETGCAYVTGVANDDTPVTGGTYNANETGHDGGSAFVTKFDSTGSYLVYSTYVTGPNESDGDSDTALGIALDSDNCAYITGSTSSVNFPTTSGSFDPTPGQYNGGFEGFLVKLSADASTVVYSSFIGPNAGEFESVDPSCIALDASNSAYVAGTTNSQGFTTTPGSFQPNYAGNTEGWSIKIDPTGSILEYATYLGGYSGVTNAESIAVDESGSAYVAGDTYDTQYPITYGAIQSTYGGDSGDNGGGDAFVTELSPSGSSLIYSTYLGGPEDDYASGIAVSNGITYITGYTDSALFPTTGGTWQTGLVGASDEFVTAIAPPAYISSFSPLVAPVGQSVTISGFNLSGTTAVDFNGVPATFNEVSDSVIVATVPANASSGPITISAPDGAAEGPFVFYVEVAPTISSFTPSSGPFGQAVTVSGNGFPGITSATIDGFTAAFSSVTPNSVVLTAPEEAGTGPIVVTNGLGNATSMANYTIIPPPTITSYSPSVGPAGTVVTVNGTNLSNASAVTFVGGATIKPSSVNATSATFVIPYGAQDGDFSITTPGGTASSPSPVTVIVVPTITAAAPDSAPIGSLVTLTGSGFTGTSAVSLDGYPAKFTFLSDTSVTFVVPSQATSATIHVKDAAGIGYGPYFIVSTLGVQSFTPTTGPVGTTVAVQGSGFTGITAASMGGVPASFSFLDDGDIAITVPPGAKTGPIAVVTPLGRQVSSSNFTVTVLAITGFSPVAGPVGTTVAVQGSGFTGINAASVGGYPASFTFLDDSDITLMVPPGAVTGPIRIKTPRGIASSSLFFDVSTLSIYSFSPTEGPVGTVVSLTGGGFTGMTAASVDDYPATFNFIDDSNIKVTVPNDAGTGPIHVLTSRGLASTAANFTVLLPPTIGSFTPTVGIVGTDITIQGTNLSTAQTVQFSGGASAVPKNVTATSVTVSIPAGATSGAFSIQTLGGSAASPGPLTVIVVPVVTGFSPSAGPVGTVVTVAGAGFTGITAASVDGYPAVFTFVNDNSVTVTVPIGADTGPIHIKNAAGLGSSPLNYTVTSLSISGFSPPAGPVGTGVTVTGNLFTGTTAVSVDGYPAAFTFVNDSTVDFIVPPGASTGLIHIKTPRGIAISATPFNVTTLAISGFGPTVGPIGTLVTVTGSAFTGITAASVDGYPAAYTFVNDGEITLTVPTGVGTGPIHIKTNQGVAASTTNFVVTTLGITGFTPTSGPPGTIVNVSGSGFTGITAGSVDGYPAQFSFGNDGTVTLVVPAAAGAGPIHIKTPLGLASSSSNFTVSP